MTPRDASFAVDFCLIIYGTFVIGMIVAALSELPCDTGQNKASSKEDQRPPDRDQTPPGINEAIDDRGGPYEAQQQSHNYKRKPMSDYERRIVILTSLIAFLTAVYALVAAFQWNEMLTANNQTKMALLISQRAYVNVREVFIKEPISVGKLLPRIWVEYENTGNTPATHFSIHSGEIRMPIPRQGFDSRPHSTDFPRLEKMGDAILPPRVIRYFPGETPRNPEMYLVTDELKTAIERFPPIYRWEVNVLIEYCDQFGDRHQSAQPFFYDSATGGWIPDAPMTQTWETKNEPACKTNEN